MIGPFQGEYGFLSNFYRHDVVMDGMTYPTLEHAYQAAKTLDQGARVMIRDARTASRAKRIGRVVPLRPQWEDCRDGAMERLLRRKFSDPVLASLLTDTGDEELVEVNWWGDRYWGVCNGQGKNRLGQLLMKIRSEIAEERAS